MQFPGQWPFVRRQKTMAQVPLNAPAPDFNLVDFTGKNVNLSDFRGSTNVLLIFNRGFM